MHSIRATICAASVVAVGLLTPLSALASSTPSDSAAAPAVSADSVASDSAANGSASVKLDACTLSGSNGRSASFSSTMAGGLNAAAIELRFDLFSRPVSGGAWTLVKGVPKFGVWDRPHSTAVVWSKSVGGLSMGQSYRVVVTHRWLTKRGSVMRTAVIASPSCDQVDARPDLALSFVGARSLSGGKTRYSVLVRNLGMTAASGFSVGMRINSLELPTARVVSLGAHKSTLVTFVAASCTAGSTLRFEADFSKEVDELNEGNNVVGTACPTMGG